MPDFPDWTRLFWLFGTSITIPINIEASDITLPVSIDAATAVVGVNIEASDVTLPISIDAATVTLDVNLATQDANIEITFADQSVAVFDAAKWFAHQAAQWTVYSQSNLGDTANLTASRVVPTGKVAFILGAAIGYAAAAVSLNIYWTVQIVGTPVATGGFNNGGAVIFDVPFRATAGQTIYLYVWNYSGATKMTAGSIWGYDADA